jgi:hypothetical protein
LNSTANTLSTSYANLSKLYQHKPFLDIKLNVVFICLPQTSDDIHVTVDHMKSIITVVEYPIMSKCSHQLSWTQFIWFNITETQTSASAATTTTTTKLLALYGSNIYSLQTKVEVFPSCALKALRGLELQLNSILTTTLE